MPHAYADVRCNCRTVKKYHCHSHDSNNFLEDFTCDHFNISVFKRAHFGWLMGFDQLAGLDFNITCAKCHKNKNITYEAKTFGKKNKESIFNCCGNNLSFHFYWDH